MDQGTCSVVECSRPPRSRFQPLCTYHYNRQRVTGSTSPPHVPTVDERFWSKVDKTHECWLWTGALRLGYGCFRGPDGKTTLAHRYAYTLLVGPIPSGMQLDHMCHNEDTTCRVVAECLHRRCVNPAHLLPATNAENSRRGRCAETNRERLRSAPTCHRGHLLEGDNVRVNAQGYRICRDCARITAGRPTTARPRRIGPDEIAQIRALLPTGMTQAAICEQVGVSNNIIWRLRKEGRL